MSWRFDRPDFLDLESHSGCRASGRDGRYLPPLRGDRDPLYYNSGEPNRGVHLGEPSGHRGEELGAHHRGKAPKLLVVSADQAAPATRPLLGVGMR